MSRAEYMRAYRARRKFAAAMMTVTEKPGWTLVADEHWALSVARIAELEEEVRHLKAELAKRYEFTPMAGDVTIVGEFAKKYPAGFNTRPFTPVPKKGK